VHLGLRLRAYSCCGFEQGEHTVRGLAEDLPLGGAVGSEQAADGTDVRGPHLAPNVVRNRVPLVLRTAVELGVHHDGVQVVLAVELVSPSVYILYRPTIATDASSGVARPAVAQRFDVAECLRALLSSHLNRSGTMGRIKWFKAVGR
jgi:hypothetical protein